MYTIFWLLSLYVPTIFKKFGVGRTKIERLEMYLRIVVDNILTCFIFFKRTCTQTRTKTLLKTVVRKAEVSELILLSGLTRWSFVRQISPKHDFSVFLPSTKMSFSLKTVNFGCLSAIQRFQIAVRYRFVFSTRLKTTASDVP